MTTSGQGNEADRDDIGREADDRLVHALLLHVHDQGAAEHREERIGRAVRAMQDETPSRNVSSEGRRVRGLVIRLAPAAKRSLVALAATIIVVIGIWVFTYSPATSVASLNDIINSLTRPGDRTYVIAMEDLPEPPQPGGAEDRPKERVPRPNLNKAKLYLRDGKQYLLVRNDPKGGVMLDGYDGQQSWRIRAGVVAETRQGPGAGGIPMPPIMADVPFTDLHQTLDRIRIDYTVEQLDDQRLPSQPELLRHVRVRRNSREVKGPETIELWADAKTATPQRIVFDRAKVQGNPQPCRITFNLMSTAALANNWFSSAAHGSSGTSRE